MRKIMLRAWEIYRALEGDHLAKLSMALRMAWAEKKADHVKITENTINALIKIGAKRWTKGGYDRLYINNAGSKIIGLSFTYRKNGKMDCAYLNGEDISNGTLGRVRNTYDRAYIDLATGDLCGVNGQFEELFITKMSEYLKKIA